MSKQTYRFARRYKEWAAGAEVQLTEDEAIQLDNEAPGVIEGIVKAEAPAPTTRKAPKE